MSNSYRFGKPNTPEGMMRMNTDTYYRLLNCGLRLAAGAGSATGAATHGPSLAQTATPDQSLAPCPCI